MRRCVLVESAPPKQKSKQDTDDATQRQRKENATETGRGETKTATRANDGKRQEPGILLAVAGSADIPPIKGQSGGEQERPESIEGVLEDKIDGDDAGGERGVRGGDAGGDGLGNGD